MLGQLADFRLRHLDHASRFLFIVPIFMLFRYADIGQMPLWIGVLIGSWFAGGYALISYILEPGVRVSGSYHPIAFGHLSLVLAFMSIPARDELKKRNINVIIPASSFTMGIIAVVLSGTRGAWIAIPALGVILFYYSGYYFRLMNRLVFSVLIILFFIGIYHIPAIPVAERMNVFFEELILYHKGDRTYSSTATRIEGYRVSIDIFKDHPIIGAGPGNYEPLMHRLNERGKNYEIAAAHSQPHSAFALAMAEGGIIGLGGLLGLFIIPLAAAIRCIRRNPHLRHLGYAWIILVIGFMHFGLTETIFGRNVNLSFYIFFTALIMAVYANSTQKQGDLR